MIRFATLKKLKFYALKIKQYMVFDLEMIKAVYERYPERVEAARKLVNKPLTLAEKILYAHLWDGNATEA